MCGFLVHIGGRSMNEIMAAGLFGIYVFAIVFFQARWYSGSRRC